MKDSYDIVIVGGGINGAGIARDAAGRGLSVLLVEKNDLASGTSSAATKLIHGGVRYLEQYEFSLVRESLKEREVLWELAPHIIHPLRFILPHQKGVRPAFLIRIGLFLYDYIGGRKKLPASTMIDLGKHEAGKPLKEGYKLAFEYSDCWVDDARLVVLNVLDAREKGADIKVRTEVTRASRENGSWNIRLEDKRKGVEENVKAPILINAAGPWVGEFLTKNIGQNSKSTVRLVKGSHIVVPKLFDHDKAYIFQNADRRIIFAIPYERDFTVIGTTDVEYEGEPGEVKISQDEIDYLCAAVSEYFSKPVKPDDIVWSFSGVRPLYDDGDADAQEVTRDFVLDVNGQRNEPVLLNIFGGKLTTYRYLAERALDKLKPWLPVNDARWTDHESLPGGDFPVEGREDLIAGLVKDYPGLPVSLLERLGRAYGTRARDWLFNAQTVEDLGAHFGADLYLKELEYLIENEWARTAEDVLWRRTKLGLRFSEQETKRLIDWFEENAI